VEFRHLTYNESGTLAYSFIDSLVAMRPYYIARAFGGLLFLIGGCIGAYNIWMTTRVPGKAMSKSGELPVPRPGAVLTPQPAE
jgi:cytochrome c oxidase cbb3-type subunit 1